MYYKHKLKTLTIQIKEPDRHINLANSSRKALEFIRPLLADKDQDQEHFGLLFLNNQNEINGFKTLFTGGMAAATVDVKNIFRNALLFGATAIICFHNHPSGNPKPSKEDEIITESIVKAGRLLTIKLLDHVIVGSNTYFSFADDGLIKRYNNNLNLERGSQ